MRICIVSSKHVSYNPRVVKEADALSAIGHAVTVVTVCNNNEQAVLDKAVVSSRPWRLLTVKYRRIGYREGLRWLYTGLRQRLFLALSAITCGFGIAERAQGREYPELKWLAGSVAADLYIAHHVEALGAAAAAALKHGARLAFDAEDFHSGMYTTLTWPMAGESLDKTVAALLAAVELQPKCPEQQRVEYLERKYLPNCDLVTAASDGIATAYALRYDLPRPSTVLNVFPLEAIDLGPQVMSAEQSPLRLYWYSQVIGPGRGLEMAVQALPLLASPCELHLRGTPQPDFVARLRNLADQFGVAERLFVHRPCPPDDLIKESACYDVGLALEIGKEINNLLAVSNKLFNYLNAGLAVVATDTPAQQAIMAQVPDAGILCRMNDANSLAEAINALIVTPYRLIVAKQAARLAAVTRFNWEVESEQLGDLIEHRAFTHPSRSALGTRAGRS